MSDSANGVMIEANALTKAYSGGFTAIKDVTFQCHSGEIVGFLGPNGAGKTTTMRILTSYMPPSSGRARIAGYDTLEQSLQARQHLGYLPENVPLYHEMRVEDYLAYIGRIRKLDDVWDRVDTALESVGLLDRAESIIGRLSKGMRQRVGLAQALLHDPDVLILDEPTIGLDPAQIREVRDLIRDLGQNHTVLLSTHILSEVEQLCDRVIMIINGQLYADMPLRTRAADEALVAVTLAAPDERTEAALAEVPGVLAVQPGAEGGQFVLTVQQNAGIRPRIAQTVVENGWGLLELTAARTNLESLFMAKLREAEAAELAALEEEE